MNHTYSEIDLSGDDPKYRRIHIPSTPEHLHGRLIAEIYTSINDPKEQAQLIYDVKRLSDDVVKYIIYDWRAEDPKAKDITILKRLIAQQIYALDLLEENQKIAQEP